MDVSTMHLPLGYWTHSNRWSSANTPDTTFPTDLFYSNTLPPPHHRGVRVRRSPAPSYLVRLRYLNRYLGYLAAERSVRPGSRGDSVLQDEPVARKAAKTDYPVYGEHPLCHKSARLVHRTVNTDAGGNRTMENDRGIRTSQRRRGFPNFRERSPAWSRSALAARSRVHSRHQ